MSTQSTPATHPTVTDGFCPSCSYDLTSLASVGVCPECGESYDPASIIPSLEKRVPGWLRNSAICVASVMGAVSIWLAFVYIDNPTSGWIVVFGLTVAAQWVGLAVSFGFVFTASAWLCKVRNRRCGALAAVFAYAGIIYIWVTAWAGLNDDALAILVIWASFIVNTVFGLGGVLAGVAVEFLIVLAGAIHRWLSRSD